MFKTHFIPFLIIGIFINPFVNVEVQAFTNYYIKQISTKDGLLQSRVQCLLIDKKGAIWIGTQAGLNCYDGYDFKKYTYQKNDSLSLPNNQIYFIAEDALSNIWVSTDQGIVQYNHDKNNFTRLYQDGSSLYACSYLLLKDGVLFGGNGAFYKYSYKSKQITTIYPDADTDISSSIYQMEMLTTDVAIVNTRWYGVYTYHLHTHEFRKIEKFQEGDYVKLLIDSQKRLWITNYGKGLYCYSSEGKLLHHFTTTNSGLSHNVIYDLKERDGKLWIATDGGGINLLSLTDGSFNYINHIPDNLNSFPSSSIICLYNDERNNMWAGSVRDGLIGIKDVDIQTFRNVPINNPYGLSSKAITSICQDANGLIWIGTDGGGINRYNPGTNLFTHYPSTNQAKITSMVELNDRELMLSIFNQGLFIFNKQTGNYRKRTLIDQATDDKLSYSAHTINISKIGNNKVLICADKIYSYSIAEDQFQVVASRKNSSFQSPIIAGTHNDQTYLLGKTEVYLWCHNNNSFRTIHTFTPKEIIHDGCKDQQNNIWLGGTFGLFRLNTQTHKVEKIETQLFDEVTSLVADKEGRLWIGTRNMLFVYLIESEDFIILGESDGVFPNEYTYQSNLISQSGDIYMGGNSGMSRINKEIRFNESSNASIYLSEIYLNGMPLNKQWKNGEKQKISVPYNFTSLQIKVAITDNDVFQTYAYQYSIVGLNDQVVQSFDPKFQIHFLPSGEYKILASYNSKTGGWTVPIEILTLNVIPPWWRSWWFVWSVIVLFIGITFAVAHYIVKKKKEKQRWELELFKQTTYEEKVRFLININHELRTPLTLIYAPLKRILNKHIADKELEGQLTGVYKQVKKMKNIINMVLDIRRMEVTQEPLHLSLYPLNDWVGSIVDDFKNEFKTKNIDLICRFDQTIEEVPYDQTKCEIILSNLLINAMKFSEADSLVTISTLLCNERVRISVIDSGIGLKDVDINKLFTRFYQGSHQQAGSGIGLSYSKCLIEMQGGSIGAENNPEKGACFYFELPLHSTMEISLPPKELLNELYCKLPENNLSELLPTDTNAYSLLVVEDEDELRNFVKESLKEQFKHIYTARNGEEAFDKVVQYQPDIIVSDVMMPVTNGFELCQRIKENLEVSHIPVILLTALSDTENTTTGYKLGADAYLTKPFELEFLQAVIGNQLKNREKIRMRYKKGDTTLTPKEMTFSNADEQFLLKLNEFIHNNMKDTELSVEIISQHMRMSRSLLFSKTKALTDMGISDYVNKLRIEKACFLLMNSDKNITEISEEVGFSTQRYFSKVFKKVTEVTPSQFKQKK